MQGTKKSGKKVKKIFHRDLWQRGGRAKMERISRPISEKEPVKAILNETIANNLAPAEYVFNKVTGRTNSTAKEFHDYGSQSLTGTLLSEALNINNAAKLPGAVGGLAGLAATSAVVQGAQTAARNSLYADKDDPVDESSALTSGALAGAVTAFAEKVLPKSGKALKKAIDKSIVPGVEKVAKLKNSGDAIAQLTKSKKEAAISGQKHLEKLVKKHDSADFKENLLTFSEGIIEKHRDLYKKIYEKAGDAAVQAKDILEDLPDEVSSALKNRISQFGESLSLQELDTIKNFTNSAIKSYAGDFQKQSNWYRALESINKHIDGVLESKDLHHLSEAAKEFYKDSVLPIKENKIFEQIASGAVDDIPSNILNANKKRVVSLIESMPHELKEQMTLYMASKGGKIDPNMADLLKALDRMPSEMAAHLLPDSLFPKVQEVNAINQTINKVKNFTSEEDGMSFVSNVYEKVPFLKNAVDFLNKENVDEILYNNSETRDILKDMLSLDKLKDGVLNSFDASPKNLASEIEMGDALAQIVKGSLVGSAKEPFEYKETLETDN